MATVTARIDKRSNGVISDRGADGYVATRRAVFDVAWSDLSDGDNEFESESLRVPGDSTLRQVTFVTGFKTLASPTTQPTVKIQYRNVTGTVEGSWTDIAGTVESVSGAANNSQNLKATSGEYFATRFLSPFLEPFGGGHREFRVVVSKSSTAADNLSDRDKHQIIVDFVNL